MNRLKLDEITTALENLDGWELDGDELVCTYEFADFVEAMGFMMRAAIWAERLNHHPTWQNTYGTVVVKLTTHDADGITRLDVELASKMNELA